MLAWVTPTIGDRPVLLTKNKSVTNTCLQTWKDESRRPQPAKDKSRRPDLERVRHADL